MPMSRRRQRSAGQVLAEFTLAIPFFLLTVVGIAEGSYFVAATTIVSSATHEGARLGVLESTAGRDAVRDRVRASALPIVTLANGDIQLKIAKVNEDGSHQALTACDDVCYQARKKDDRLVVSTAYAHTPLLGYAFGGASFPASATAELIVEGDAT